MWSALCQFPLQKLEIVNAPDLSDFPALTDIPSLQELSVAGCETEGSKHINLLSKHKSDLVVFFQNPVDKQVWQQAGYVYQQGDNPAANAEYQGLAQSVAPIDLSAVAWDEIDADDADTGPSLFERMRTESVSEFFGLKSKSEDDTAATTDTDAQEPSLFERMRTESVGDFFRKRK